MAAGEAPGRGSSVRAGSISGLLGVAAACGAGLLLAALLANPHFAVGIAEHLVLLGFACGLPMALGAAAALGTRGRARRDGDVATFWGCSVALTGVACASLVVAGHAPAWLALGAFGAAAGIAGLVRAPRLRAALLPCASLLVAAASVGGVPELPPAPARQVAVVGVDGADWRIIDALAERGRLRALADLQRRGARGTIRTLEPTLSPMIWTSIASGVTPDRHGITGFFASARDVRARRIWEIAADHGLTAGTLGYLVTWPPSGSIAFSVPGWLARDDRTRPPALGFLKVLERALLVEERAPSPLRLIGLLPAAVRHGVTLDALGRLARSAVLAATGADPRRREIAGREAAIALGSDVFCHLLRRQRPALSLYYHNHVDAVGHLYFKYFDPTGFPEVGPAEAERFGDALPRMYEATDAALAKIEACLGERGVLLVVSDHGQQAARSGEVAWPRLRFRPVLDALGLADDLQGFALGRLVWLVPSRAGVDLAAARRRLAGVSYLPSGAPVIDLREVPDGLAASLPLQVDPDRRIRLGTRETRLGEIADTSHRTSGTHTHDAFLLLAGPGIAAGQRVSEGSVLDVAPTVLALLGLPVGRDMPGSVLTAALTPEARRDLEVRYVASHGAPPSSPNAGRGSESDVDADTRRRLEHLGYLE